MTSVTGVDLQKMAPSTLIESLSQLRCSPATWRPTSGRRLGRSRRHSLNLTGSTLRGRGASRWSPPRTEQQTRHRRRPVIPETLVRSVEAITGGASPCSADAVAGVVNFRLDRKLDGFRAFQAGATTYGDEEYKAGIGYGTDIGEPWAHHRGRRDLHKGHRRFQLPPGPQRLHKSQIPGRNPDRTDQLPDRPFVSPTFTPGGIICSGSPTLDHVEFLPGGAGTTIPFSGGVTTGGCNEHGRASVRRQLGLRSRRPRTGSLSHYDHTSTTATPFFVETRSPTQQQDRWQTALARPGRQTVRDNRSYRGYSPENAGRAPIRRLRHFPPNLPAIRSKAANDAKNTTAKHGWLHANLSDKFLGGNWALDSYVRAKTTGESTRADAHGQVVSLDGCGDRS